MWTCRDHGGYQEGKGRPKLVVVAGAIRPLHASLTQACCTSRRKSSFGDAAARLRARREAQLSGPWARPPSPPRLPGRAVAEGHVRKAYAALSRPGGRADEEMVARPSSRPRSRRCSAGIAAVVADGALQYVLFAALRDPSSEGPGSARSWAFLPLRWWSGCRGRLPHDSDRQVAIVADLPRRRRRRLAHHGCPRAWGRPLRSAEDVGVTCPASPAVPAGRPRSRALAP
jgi:hypothetical protein